MCELVKTIDKTNGYVYGMLDPVTENLFAISSAPTSWEYEKYRNIYWAINIARLGDIRERCDFQTPEEMQQELREHAEQHKTQQFAQATNDCNNKSSI